LCDAQLGAPRLQFIGECVHCVLIAGCGSRVCAALSRSI